MDKNVKQIGLALAAAAAVAVAVYAWQQSGARRPPRVPWSGSLIDWGRPAAHGCDTGWMGDMLGRPHPVYRQQQPGACRDKLSRYGWQWITDPPAEQEIAGE